jgi:hypothetical protein
LRNLGVRDAALSLVSRHEPAGGGAAEGAGKGALAGAGVGTLFGLAAAFIPGIGPFITAGALASALGVTGGAAAAGAIVGGTSGAVAGRCPGPALVRRRRITTAGRSSTAASW